MQEQKKAVIKSKVHPNEYINKDTGEVLSSECKDNISITLNEDTNHFVINSDNYVVFDAGAMEYLNSALVKADVSRIFMISNMIKGDCSVIYQGNNHPHNSDTLSVTLNLSKDKFYKMVRRLVDKNVLAYVVCAPSGYTQKIYMLNPFIARKRKTFNNGLNAFFRDITKPYPIQDKIS